MINEETYWQIRRLSEVHKLNSVQIADQLGLSAPTVRRWLKSDRWEKRRQPSRSSIIEPHEERIRKLLNEHPYTAVQIFQILQKDEGYRGSYSQVRRFVNRARPSPVTAYMRLKFRPGEAMQVDFGKCGTVPCGNTSRRLSVLVVTLCHSRLMYAEFFPYERLEHFLTGIRHALEYFGGVPEKVVVDNCKTAVLHHSRHGGVQFHPRFSELAAHYGFSPAACTPRSPQEKGQVENGVKYIKSNFMAGRCPSSLQQDDADLRRWLEQTANVRTHGTTREQPLERFRREEQPALGSLPFKPADCAVTEHHRADKCCRVSFDGNRYSVPEKYARKQLTVRATPEKVLLYEGEMLTAQHPRSYERNAEIVNPEHEEDMRRKRRRAREQNLEHDFLTLGSAAETFRNGLEAGQLNPRSHLRRIMALVEMYGTGPVTEALENAVAFHAFRAEYVEHLTEQYSKGGECRKNPLHIPRAGDALDLEIDEPDMNQYNI